MQPQSRASFADRPLEGERMGISGRRIPYLLLRRRLVPADETRAKATRRLPDCPFPVGGRCLHNGSAGAGGERRALQRRRTLLRGLESRGHWENACLVLSTNGPKYFLANPN